MKIRQGFVSNSSSSSFMISTTEKEFNVTINILDLINSDWDISQCVCQSEKEVNDYYEEKIQDCYTYRYMNKTVNTFNIEDFLDDDEKKQYFQALNDVKNGKQVIFLKDVDYHKIVYKLLEQLPKSSDTYSIVKFE